MTFYHQYFPLIFWHMWQMCWTASFPEQPSPCLGYLKTSGLCWQLLLGSKNFPKNLSVQSSTKIIRYIVPSPRKRKWSGHMSTYRMIIIICIITPPCIMLLCRHSHPWGFLTQLKNWLWNRKALHATMCKNLWCSEWTPGMGILIGLCSIEFLCGSDNAAPVLNGPFVGWEFIVYKIYFVEYF